MMGFVPLNWCRDEKASTLAEGTLGRGNYKVSRDLFYAAVSRLHVVCGVMMNTFIEVMTRG